MSKVAKRGVYDLLSTMVDNEGNTYQSAKNLMTWLQMEGGVGPLDRADRPGAVYTSYNNSAPTLS